MGKNTVLYTVVKNPAGRTTGGRYLYSVNQDGSVRFGYLRERHYNDVIAFTPKQINEVYDALQTVNADQVVLSEVTSSTPAYRRAATIDVKRILRNAA